MKRIGMIARIIVGGEVKDAVKAIKSIDWKMTAGIIAMCSAFLVFVLSFCYVCVVVLLQSPKETALPMNCFFWVNLIVDVLVLVCINQTTCNDSYTQRIARKYHEKINNLDNPCNDTLLRASSKTTETGEELLRYVHKED